MAADAVPPPLEVEEEVEVELAANAGATTAKLIARTDNAINFFTIWYVERTTFDIQDVCMCLILQKPTGFTNP